MAKCRGRVNVIRKTKVYKILFPYSFKKKNDLEGKLYRDFVLYYVTADGFIEAKKKALSLRKKEDLPFNEWIWFEWGDDSTILDLNCVWV